MSSNNNELIRKIVHTDNTKEIIDFFLEKKIFTSNPKCQTCKSDTKLVEKKNLGDGYAWRCVNYKCSTFISVRKYSFISESKLALTKIIYIIYQQLRVISLKDLNRNKIRLGGNGSVVEIDESLFIRVKHNKGKDLLRSQVWVFGLHERSTKKTLFFIVKSRDAHTLLNIIYEYVLPNTIIYSDCLSVESIDDDIINGLENLQLNKVEDEDEILFDVDDVDDDDFQIPALPDFSESFESKFETSGSTDRVSTSSDEIGNKVVSNERDISLVVSETPIIVNEARNSVSETEVLGFDSNRRKKTINLLDEAASTPTLCAENVGNVLDDRGKKKRNKATFANQNSTPYVSKLRSRTKKN